MNTNLLNFVLDRLDQRQPSWAEVARSTGVPYDTLKKIATRVTPNPGVRHVQVLFDYFQAQAPAAIAQAATETAAPEPIQTIDAGALRTDTVRRHAERRAENANRRSKEAAAERDRRAKGGPPFQSLETGVA